MIEVEGLTKRYKSVVAVDGIDLVVPDGVVFAFLGSNGAGKSTTIGCITTVLGFDAGTIRVQGHDVVSEGDAVRRRIGVVFQNSLLDPQLTVRENLAFRARLSGLSRTAVAPRIAELAGLVQFEEFLDRRYARLSGGQRRRVDIARALLHQPDVLFLDEPTAGLDPASRSVVWQTMDALRAEHGMTVFLTTHYMEETEQADRVCVIDRGRIIADDTAASLRAMYSRSILTITSSDPAALVAEARRIGAAPSGDGAEVTIEVPDAATARALLAAHGDHVRDFEFRHGRMDDVFLALTGREHADHEDGTEAA